MTEQAAAPSAMTTRLVGALKTPRAKRIVLWLGGFLVFFGLFGYFAGPPLLKSLLLKQLSGSLHREVSIERIDINPYALSLRVSGVSVKAAGGKEVAGVDELLVNVSTASFFQFGAILDAVRVRGPRLAVARLADGKYDVSDLLDEWLAPSEPSPTPRFSLNNIQIEGGKIEFDDRPVGKLHTLSDIRLDLPFVSSLPYQAERLVEPHFSANVNGAVVRFEGNSKPFSPSRDSELNLDVSQFDLTAVQAYLPATLPFRLHSGAVDAALKLVFKEFPDQRLSLSLLGSVHVSSLDLRGAQGQALAGCKRLDIELQDVDLVNRQVAVQRVTLDGLDAHLTVNRQGEFNLLMLAEKLGAQPAGAEPAAAVARPLAWSLGELRLSNGLLRWRDDSNPTPVHGEMRDLHATVGKVDSRLADPIEISEVAYQVDLGERFQVAQMLAKGIRVDLHGHRVDIAEVSNRQTRARLLRNKEGKIEWISPPLLKSIKESKEELSDARPWGGRVGKLAISDLALRLEDQTTTPAAVQVIDGFNLTAEGLSTEAGHPGSIALHSRINQTGSLKVEGSLQPYPLVTRLQVETQAVSVLPLQPYFTEFLNIALTRGVVSSRGEVLAEIGKQGLNAGYKGALTLGDLLAVDKVNNADFLKWKSLYLGAVDFKLQPKALNVGEIALTDFYSRLIVSPQGRLNLADIVRKPEAASEAAGKPAESGEPRKVAEKAPEQAAVSEPPAPMPIKIAKITLQNGRVRFSDFFVKPNYSVNLTQLGGRVSGLSSAAGSVADLDLRARYANSAPVRIVAKLNPLAAKAYLDLQAEVTGVDLVGLSPYAGKYAGYNIDKGKLSLNVAYKLENNQLTADNRLFVDQLTFGDKVDSPDATTLPVNLAISLLKNNRGEININLPISGSLDDPQFSVGGLIVKVIVNLFVKAVTSPFALLGSMFGGDEELSNVEFAPGRARLDEPAGKKLEALAKALTEREALKLEITGRADPEADKEGLKRVAIERAMQAEKRKDIEKKGGQADALGAIAIAPDEYPAYLKRAYREAKFPKPRNLIGLQKDLPVEEMEKLLLANLPVTDDDVQRLAARRAEAVQNWLVEQGKVPAERVYLLAPKVEADEKGKASRVDFSLR